MGARNSPISAARIELPGLFCSKWRFCDEDLTHLRATCNGSGLRRCLHGSCGEARVCRVRSQERPRHGVIPLWKTQSGAGSERLASSRVSVDLSGCELTALLLSGCLQVSSKFVYGDHGEPQLQLTLSVARELLAVLCALKVKSTHSMHRWMC